MPMREKKRPGGIALRPSLWRRIEALAASKDMSLNAVMEQVLDLHVPAVPNSHEIGYNRHAAADEPSGRVAWSLQDEHDDEDE